MASTRSGLPTPSENWDDDFDFDPSPIPPASTSSSRTTSSSHSGLIDIARNDVAYPSSELKTVNVESRPRAVESWDDDFDYDPLDWTKDTAKQLGRETKTGPLTGSKRSHLESASQPEKENADISHTIFLTQPLPVQSTSSLISDKTTSRAVDNVPAHQRSISSFSSQSTAQSFRRDRKRSFRFISTASSSSLNIDRNPQRTGSIKTDQTKNIYPGVIRDSSDDNNISRVSLDSRASSSRKLRLGGLSSEAVKEGSFGKRMASIRRRISSSLSTAPSAVANPGQSRTSFDMPPPPVPASAFPLRSNVKDRPLLDKATAGLPRLSFDDRDPTGPSGGKSYFRSSSRGNEPVQGLPTRTSSRTSTDTQHHPRSISGVISSESGSSLPFLHVAESTSDNTTEGRAISPTSPPGLYQSSSFSSPSPSITSLASHAGGYGFHFPSPATGSAYNIFGSSNDQSTQRGHVLDSSVDSNSATRDTHVDNHASESGVLASVSNHDEQETPKANKTLRRTRPGDQAVLGITTDMHDSLSPGQSPTSRIASQPSSQLVSELQSHKSAGRTASHGGSSGGTQAISSAHTSADVEHAGHGKATTLAVKSDEAALTKFRFAGKDAERRSSQGMAAQLSRNSQASTVAAETVAPTNGSPGKARLTLRRIGSISRRHSRRISDGWRAVSGHTASPVPFPSMNGTKDRDQPQTILPTIADGAREVRAKALPPVQTVQRSSTTRELERAQMPSSEVSPDFRTFGRDTSTPPRPALLSPSRPIHMPNHHSTPSGSQAVSAAMRSLSQNDSPSASKISGSNAEVAGDNGGANRPPINPRRNSLGDLKIPSRVVSAQKGLREEIGAMKQFASGIRDLKALMAQRTILQAKQERLGITDTSLENEYAQWWSLADLLLQLGETGSLDGNSSGGMLGADYNIDTRRERRITLAADKVLPPSHLSRLINSDETSSVSSATGVAPFISDRNEFGSPMRSASPGTGRTSNLWRASTGRTDFSSAQLEQLRVILDRPRAPALETIVDSSVQPRTIALPTMEPETTVPVETTGSNVAVPVDGLPRFRASANAGHYGLGVGSTTSQTRPSAGQRRSSKSTLGAIRDFWRVSGGSQRSGHSDGQHVVPPTQQPRPSLSSIFRRSSQKVTSITDVAGGVSGNAGRNGGKQEDRTPSLSTTTPDTATSDDHSQTSSVSDWDAPPPRSNPGESSSSGHDASQPNDRFTILGKPQIDDLTITRSDSRKMLTALGRGQSPSVEGKSSSLSPIRPDFQIPAFSTSPQEISRLDLAAPIPLTLTPASLPALVDKLTDVTEHCRVHLEAVSKRLKGQT